MLNLEQATAKAARYAELQGAIGTIDAKRTARLAKVGAIADAKLAPLIEERSAIAADLETWFGAAPAELLQGKKSIPLAGGTIGKRTGNATLVVPTAAALKKAIASLARCAWAKSLLRPKVELEKNAIKKAMDGPNKAALKKLGFAVVTPETFFIEISAPSIAGADRMTRTA